VLPRTLREPIGLAYLLARAADTVADTRLIPRPERLRHLETLKRAFVGEPVDTAPVAAACAPGQAQAAERRLLERLGETIAHLDGLGDADRREVRRVLANITGGQIADLEQFPGEDAASLTALPTRAALDAYTYMVAGCVGEFWTALHIAHRRALANWDPRPMSAKGVRFGKALQLTNILRDVSSDLRNGRCYLPRDELAALGLTPHDLLDPSRTPGARPLFAQLLAEALGHYDVAWHYTLAIPRREWRMRLACVWPLLIGLATLAALARAPDPLASPAPIKIPRREVRRLLGRSALTVWSNRALAADAARLRARVHAS